MANNYIANIEAHTVRSSPMSEIVEYNICNWKENQFFKVALVTGVRTFQKK